VLACFCPQLPEKAGPILLKILVDCSGSMAGDSIVQAKKALQTILRELSAQDFCSFSRFGGRVHHAAPVMVPCTTEALERFASMVQRTDADMGGTEMEKAICSTCKDIAVPEDVGFRPSILLITDDLYWSDGDMPRQAAKSGHRFFAVGVGSAPAESLLRQLAEKTGGACEFVTPNEDMAAAIVRMFRRMRAGQANKLRIDWGREPEWQTPLPRSIFDGDTLHVFAAFAERPTQPPTLSWEGDAVHVAPESIAMTENPDLVRLGAAQRMLQAGKTKALALALKYRLVSAQTSLFLAYLRAEEDKVTELPELCQVPQMMAAGSHGFGTVRASEDMPSFIRRSKRNGLSQEKDYLVPVPQFIPHSKRPGRPRQPRPDRRPARVSPDPNAPLHMLELFEQMVLAKRNRIDMADIANVLASTFTDQNEFVNLLGELEGVSAQMVWAALLDWFFDRLADVHIPARQARRLLRAELKSLDVAQMDALHAAFVAKWPLLPA
jgi:uncharacterized protein YegL